jgi:phage terminase Nu1 subunit (DNA packaging protein)
VVELRRKELVKCLGISDRTLSRWIKRKLPFTLVKEGFLEHQVFDIEEVLLWMNQQSKEVKRK